MSETLQQKIDAKTHDKILGRDNGFAYIRIRDLAPILQEFREQIIIERDKTKNTAKYYAYSKVLTLLGEKNE